MPAPPPSLSARPVDVRFFPARDILELRQQAEVISPAEELTLRLSLTTRAPAEIAEGLAALRRPTAA